MAEKQTVEHNESIIESECKTKSEVSEYNGSWPIGDGPRKRDTGTQNRGVGMKISEA
jgi:hypothetical protein